MTCLICSEILIQRITKDKNNLMYISPSLALILDTIAAFFAQSGYIVQKKGH